MCCGNTQPVLSPGVAQCFEQLAGLVERVISVPQVMPGPTGEENTLRLFGRGVVAVVAAPHDTASTLAQQIGLALAAGCAVALAADAEHCESVQALRQLLGGCGLEALVCSFIPECATQLLQSPFIAAASVTGNAVDSGEIRRLLAAREGPLVPLVEVPSQASFTQPSDWLSVLIALMVERTFTDNLVAKGGNTQLFNLAEEFGQGTDASRVC